MAVAKIKIVPFPVPFEVQLDLPGDKRTSGPTIRIADLDDETLEALCEEFVKAVYQRKKADQGLPDKPTFRPLDGHNA